MKPEALPLPVLQDEPGCCREQGPAHWRSLEEKLGARDPDALADEFPPGASDPPEGVARRTFLQLLGSSLALAGMNACFQHPPEKIMPYSRRQPELTPGTPLHFATASALGGLATGWVVTSREGRPIKIEGNPEHPSSLGATTPLDQASILQLYNPHRSTVIKHRGQPLTDRDLLQQLNGLADRLEADGGAKLRFLLEPNASPLLANLRSRIRGRYPHARIDSYAPLGPDNAYEGTRLAFGTPLQVVPKLDAARVVLSLDEDFLAALPGNLRLIREFTSTREPGPELSRLYVVESRMSLTGGFADHRLRLRPSQVQPFALALTAAVADASGRAELRRLVPTPPTLPADQQKWVRAIAKDLLQAGERALVLVGERQPPQVHALAHALHQALGGVGRTVRYLPAALPDTRTGPGVLRLLAQEIAAGQVDTLVITAWNPAYTAPVDVGLDALLAKVPNAIYLGYFEDETAGRCSWFVPAAHTLESWGDARAEDGTVSIVQPLIAPLCKGLTEADVLSPFAGAADVSPHDQLKMLWRQKSGTPSDFDARWEDWLAAGVLPGRKLEPPANLAVQWDAVAQAARASPAPHTGELEVSFVPDYKVWDGRFADNAWLQELPDPVTQLSWDNAVLLSPTTATRLGMKSGDVAELSYAGLTLEAPVWILPGQPDDTATLPLGYGRQGGTEKVARGVGFNAWRLRHSDAPWFDGGLRLRPTGRDYTFACAQTHWSMEGRELALEKPAGDFQKDPKALEHLREPPDTLYDSFKQEDQPYRWAMAIDLTRCTGCSACVVACQAENNILTVGKDNVRKGREMHWLRIDRYFTGADLENPGVITQPVLCMHCEAAPCEYVCPVNATVHSDEGLNDMVYNRCIGTRDCSNNCPYKVRRFNYLNYRKNLSEIEHLAHNPDVTLRSRGVMEKCTYCVQRIESARIRAQLVGRRIREDDLQTACQQACPARVISFGSLTDAEARVTRLHRDERRYDLLHDLGTRPRTVYLLRIKNPNRELA